VITFETIKARTLLRTAEAQEPLIFTKEQPWPLHDVALGFRGIER
jgi:hypothetical protein